MVTAPVFTTAGTRGVPREPRQRTWWLARDAVATAWLRAPFPSVAPSPTDQVRWHGDEATAQGAADDRFQLGTAETSDALGTAVPCPSVTAAECEHEALIPGLRREDLESTDHEVATVVAHIFRDVHATDVLPRDQFFASFYPLVGAAQATPDRKAAVIRALERLQSLGLLSADPDGTQVLFFGYPGHWVP